MRYNRILLSWSGGKDSALALHELRREDRHEIVAMLTTFSADDDRVSHHGVRRELIERQAAAAGIPMRAIALPTNCPPEHYAAIMRETMLEYRAQGVSAVAFGDIFLESLREYRERNLAQVGLDAIFPIWGHETGALFARFLREGFRACIVCADARRLDASFAGRSLDRELLRDLPTDVDPCGENGEYHSFVHDGPIFDRPIDVIPGATFFHNGAHHIDLLPDTAQTSESISVTSLNHP